MRSAVSVQFHWERTEIFNAGFCHDVVILDPHAGAENFFVVEAGLGGEDVADLEGVVPVGVQVRGFVGEEADAVAEMMVEDTNGGLVQDGLGFVE